ncbi:MAG: EAL domain-containing protein [Leptospirillum sp.]
MNPFDFSRFFEQAPDGIFFMDPDSLIVLEANGVFLKMLGYSRQEEIVGKPVSFFTNSSEPETRRIIQSLDRSALHSQNTKRRFRRLDGARIHVSVSYSYITYGQARVIMAHVRDVSREMESETFKQISLELDRMILLGEPLDSLLSMIVKRLDESFHFLMTYFSIPNPDGTIRYVEIASSVPDFPEQFMAASKDFRWDIPPGMYRVSSKSLHTRKPLFVTLEDFRDSPLFSWYKEVGLSVSQVIPILRKDKSLLPWGTLTVNSQHEQYISPEFRKQLIEFSEKIRLAFIRYEEQSQLRLQKAALDSSRTPFFIATPNGKIQWANRAFFSMIRYPHTETCDLSLQKFFPVSSEEGALSFQEVCHEGNFYQGEVHGVAYDGTSFVTETVVSPLTDEKGVVTQILVHQKDITVEKDQEKKIWRLAHIDSLTGLLNRNAFIEQFRKKIQLLRGTTSEMALLFIDLDGFKEINDSLGHAIGDQFLCVMAERLLKMAKRGDLVGRIGGDEFLLLCPIDPDRSVFNEFLQRFLEVMAAPVQLHDHLLVTTVSVGISCFPDDGDTEDLLLRKADIAMYQAKNLGKNTYRYFEKEFEEKIQIRYEKTQSLRNAVARKEFVFFYQPQVNVEQNRVVGVEALIRWNMPGKNSPIFPSHFISLAEETGLIVPIGNWGIQTAMETIRQLKENGFPRIRVALNFSARQFWNNEFWDKLLLTLDENREILDWFSAELTESLLMKDLREASNRLNILRSMGIRISIDDFGVGYSSLSYLTQLPTDEIKVPQEFVLRMLKSPADLALVKTIIQMAQNLNLQVVAEGAQTQQEIDMLKSLSCPVIQGFGISRPLPLEELEIFLAQDCLQHPGDCSRPKP